MRIVKTLAEKQEQNPQFRITIKDVEKFHNIARYMKYGRDVIKLELQGKPARACRFTDGEYWGYQDWFVTPEDDKTTSYLLTMKELFLNTNILDII